jgi:serine/threonine-protein kinase PpkA
MAMTPSHESNESLQLLQVGVELGFIGADKVDGVLRQQKVLKRKGVSLPISQILLELQLITVPQLRTITDEFEVRRAQKGSGLSTGMLKATEVRKLGKFDVIKVLSESGYTRVFKAKDTEKDRIVVLKVLPPTLSTQSQWYERFRREMFLVGNLSHPNIVSVHECGSVENSPFIAFEFLEGQSVANRLERSGNFPERTAWLVAREVAKGLAYIEEHGVLHRDMKPENILCCTDGKVKIIDLGLSRSLLNIDAITAVGETVGTPFYMSPEQAQGTSGLDHRTDLYALGCIAYHMLTGAVPFFAEDAMAVMLKHNEAPRPDPREVVTALDPGSTKLVNWLMGTTPDERPESATTLIPEIDKLLASLPSDPATAHTILKVSPS